MEKNNSGGSPPRRPAGAPRADRPRGEGDDDRGRAGQSGRPSAVVQPAPVDIERERVVPFGDVPKLGIIPVRRRGTRLNLRTVYRWATVGLRGVVLPTQLVGAQRVTSVEALLRFFDAVSAAARAGGGMNGGSRNGGGRGRSSGPDVDEELDRLGF